MLCAYVLAKIGDWQLECFFSLLIRGFWGEREKREAKMGDSLPAYSFPPSKISFPRIPKVRTGVGLP